MSFQALVKVAFILLAAWHSGEMFSTGHQSVQSAGAANKGEAPAVDSFGGLTDLPSSKGSSGNWGAEKFNNHWLLVTPAGHGFFLLGVYNVSGDTHPDDLRGTYDSRVIKKYGDKDITWGPQQNRRLKSWGFNAVTTYGVTWTWPTQKDPHWKGGEQPVKMPIVVSVWPSRYCRTNLWNLAPRPCKSLMHGVNPKYYGGGGEFPDVFDTNFDLFVDGLLTHDTTLQPTLQSPWTIGIQSDDSDDLRGFGSGVDFPTQPAGNEHPHLGYIAVITRPTQERNPFDGKPYADAVVYTKRQLKQFLLDKYGSVAALNTAWGSSYDSFDSDGGWGMGKGLMDEDGRHTAWLGNNPYTLAGASPGAKADMDAFLFELAKKYFEVMKLRIGKRAPGKMFFGPTVTGAWRSPARRQILRAAGLYVDVLSTSLDAGNPAILDFVGQFLGDKAVILWQGSHANADSAAFRYRDPNPGSVFAYPNQKERGLFYARELSTYLNATASSTGANSIAGLLWWEFHDNWGEKANWGLVSLMDNAYDGKESTVSGGKPGVNGSAQCKDPWGYSCGAEERDYGDFVSSVRDANMKLLNSIVTAGKSR